MVLTGNKKSFLIIGAHRLVDSTNKGTSMWKAQFERDCGKVKDAKYFREELIKQLKSLL